MTDENNTPESPTATADLGQWLDSLQAGIVELALAQGVESADLRVRLLAAAGFLWELRYEAAGPDGASTPAHTKTSFFTATHTKAL
jgi:hypothetical protein